MDDKKFYITTAIAYVNANPHIGYAYEVIASDILARFHRLKGYDTFFLTGSDEHSMNVAKKADSLCIPPMEYCDNMVAIYKDTWKALGIEYDEFIRTTSARHRIATEKIINTMYQKRDVYKGIYKGGYCVSCEAFLQDKDLVSGACPVHRITPEWVEEENYFFALTNYQTRLLRHITDNPDFIQPDTRRNEILNIIKGGLEDISISRASVKWGIPFPLDDSQVVYVWFDALINYISGVDYGTSDEHFNRYWPSDLHVIGKDIIRFHCIIWPAMLMSVGIELPKKIFAHGFINVGAEKISKTKGNLLDPRDIVKELKGEFGVDALRYFLLREIPFGMDGNFSIEALIKRFDSDLADDLGNLIYRTMTMVEKYFSYKVPSYSKDSADVSLAKSTLRLADSVEEYMTRLDLSGALASIWTVINKANKYIEESTPWKLAKEKNAKELSIVIYTLLETLRIVAILIFPFMPKVSAKIWEQLNINKPISTAGIEDARKWGILTSGIDVKKAMPIFPRIVEKVTQ